MSTNYIHCEALLNEYKLHTFLWRNKKNISTVQLLKITCLKLRCDSDQIVLLCSPIRRFTVCWTL